MTKKDDDNDDRHDFTSIGDMTEFLHPEDMEAELKFKQLNGELFPEKEETFQETSIDDLPDSLHEELPPDLPIETLPDDAFVENTDLSSESLEEIPVEEDFDSTLVADISIPFPLEMQEEISEEISEIYNVDELQNEAEILVPENISEVLNEPERYKEPENFKEVKTFAQNFSYAKLPAGGNPPFSLILKNIKFKEDADSILALLREYKISTPDTEKEFIRSIEFGSLLIPQINEYLAILLTHKCRRFDCEIEMGLSDQIQPSKSGEINPRGLTNKTHINQNKREKIELNNDDVVLSEIIISTTPTLVGHKITKYLGVETSFRMIETEDLERLHFIQRSLSEALQTLNEDTQADYSNFTSNFHQIYTDLINELKEKAHQKKSNALLGVSFSLTPFLTEKQTSQNKYQLTCTATLVIVTKENILEANETL